MGFGVKGKTVFHRKRSYSECQSMYVGDAIHWFRIYYRFDGLEQPFEFILVTAFVSSSSKFLLSPY